MAIIQQDNRLARIIGAGLVLVATDLHGNFDDFNHLRTIFSHLWMHSQKKTRPVLLITGDLFHGPSDTKAWLSPGVSNYQDQSARLFRELMTLLRAYPNQATVLLGNHDHAHIGGPKTSKFYADEAAVFEKTLSQREIFHLEYFLRSLPLVAISEGNVVFTHASAPSSPISINEIKNLQYEGYRNLYPIDFMHSYSLGELLWRRKAPETDTLRFIKAMTGHKKGIHIHGHNVAPRGFHWESSHELCFSSSFGAKDFLKTVVLISNQALYDNREIACESGIVQLVSDVTRRIFSL